MKVSRWMLTVLPVLVSGVLSGQDPLAPPPGPKNNTEQSSAHEEAWLGIYPVNLSTKARATAKLRGQPGVEIRYVASGSPAEKAGLVIGDILQFVEEQRIYNADQLRQLLPSLKPETTVTLRIVRGEEKHEFAALLGKRSQPTGSGITDLSQKDLLSTWLEKGVPPGLPGFSVTSIARDGERITHQDVEGTIELWKSEESVKVTILDRSGNKTYEGSVESAPNDWRDKIIKLRLEWTRQLGTRN